MHYSSKGGGGEGCVCLFYCLYHGVAGSVDWVRISVVSHVLASSMNPFRSCFITSVDRELTLGWWS
jgi:hypothetical protein